MFLKDVDVYKYVKHDYEYVIGITNLTCNPIILSH